MNRAIIVAEAGVNHEGSLPRCLRMVEEATRAGCDVFKVQVYDPEQLATGGAQAYWQGGKGPQQDFYRAHPGLSMTMLSTVAARCRVLGIEFCVSVFHVEDVGWLAMLVDVFKIASGDITHRALLRAVAATGKPVLISTGASDCEEIADAAAILHGETLLHCTLSYPTKTEDANLSAIPDLKSRFPGHPVGYSDHTLPHDSNAVICAAYTLGATVFEKHYTLDKSLPGNDHYHSFDPKDFARLRHDLDAIQASLGSGGKRVLDCELPARLGARRSLTALSWLPAGTRLERGMVAMKRPGHGLLRFPVGTITTLVDIDEDETITADMVRIDTARHLELLPLEEYAPAGGRASLVS